MPAISTSAPGKIILLGEHSVVYGQPAIAVPVTEVKAKAIVTAEPRSPSGRIRLQAPAIGLYASLDELPEHHPIAAAVHRTLEALSVARPPACTIRVTSTIPVASGMGSGAAVTVAVIRGLSTFLGKPSDDEITNSIAFEVEKIYHGTPSGIDNTVVTYAKPVYFQREHPIELLRVPKPFSLVIGDTGITSSTKITVGDVRQARQADPVRYEGIFSAIGEIVETARQMIEDGKPSHIGHLMIEDHRLLQQLGVSSPELERLVEAALEAGAQGAKLSGGGRGGNMIALAATENTTIIEAALRQAGAVNTILTTVGN